MRIVHGFHDICGIASAIAVAEHEQLGYDTEVIVWNDPRWGATDWYRARVPVHKNLNLAGAGVEEKRLRRNLVLAGLLDNPPDILHVHFNDTTSSVTVMERQRSNVVEEVLLSDAAMMDLVQLHEAGVRIWATFHGCDIRRKGGDPVCSECTYEPCAFEDQTRERRQRALEDVAERVFVTTPDLLRWAPEATVIPQATPDPLEVPGVQAAFWRRVLDLQPGRKLRVVHCPSSTEKKGTRWVREAVKACSDSIEYVELHGQPRARVMEEIANADLLVDQMLIGWWGTIAAEAAAIGIPTVVYLADDAVRSADVEFVGNALINEAIIPVTRDGAFRASSFGKVSLADTLWRLASEFQQNPRRFKSRAWMVRDFWRTYHDPKAVVERLHGQLPPRRR